MRVAAFLLTAMMTVAVLTLGGPTTTYADPAATQSAESVPYGQFVHLNFTGMAPSSPLTVSYSVGNGDPWHTVVSFDRTDARGSAEVLFSPLQAGVDRNYQGVIWILVCDNAQHCFSFSITIGSTPPVIVGHNKADQAWCDLLEAILEGHYPGPDPIFVLQGIGENAVVQLALRCGNFTETEIQTLLVHLFGPF